MTKPFKIYISEFVHNPLHQSSFIQEFSLNSVLTTTYPKSWTLEMSHSSNIFHAYCEYIHRIFFITLIQVYVLFQGSILQGFLTNLAFMDGYGCLLIFCMLKRHVETKKSFMYWSPSSQLWVMDPSATDKQRLTKLLVDF